MRQFAMLFLSVACLGFVPASGQSFHYAESHGAKLKDIKLGMSPSEVRHLFGSPSMIESGFPNSDWLYFDVDNFPEQVGQVNNSTWFYVYSPKAMNGQVLYDVNGHRCSKDIYGEYTKSDVVYIRHGEVISPNAGESYLSLKDGKTVTEEKNPSATHLDFRSESQKATHKVRISVVLCVIFDKGTESVAAVKNFLLVYQ